MSVQPSAVRPEHLLRALLDDRLVRDLLTVTGTDPDELRAGLERVCLDALDVVDEERLYAGGVDLAALLTTLNAPRAAAGPLAATLDPYWLTGAARECLLRAVAEAARTGTPTVTTGHVLLGLLRSRDHTIVRVLRAVPVVQRALRAQLHRWGRRAG